MKPFKDFEKNVAEIPTARVVTYCAVLYLLACLIAGGN